MTSTREAEREKRMVALSSVGAAIALTVIKIVVAVLTGSLGIRAEAVHSGLDLVAAFMTLFAVQVAAKPADATHHYGHSKVENLSAFFEALLLLGTALWIISEAVRRLIYQEHVEMSIWAFVVMIIAILVDFTRSRALLHVARKLGSQALEADALHFKTDIWSSLVVIAGLVIVSIQRTWPLPAWLAQADAVAALGVSLIVIWVSIHLAKETIDALTDHAPQELSNLIQDTIRNIKEVTEVRRVRVRHAGSKLFVDLVIAASCTLTFEQIHELSEHVEDVTIKAVHQSSPTSEVDVLVHVKPIRAASETITERILYLAARHSIRAHDIRIREVDKQFEVDFDLEVQADMDLREAHKIATCLEQAILTDNPHLRRITTHLEALSGCIARREDITTQHSQMTRLIIEIADKIAGQGSTHDVHLYQPRFLQAGSHTNQRSDRRFSKRGSKARVRTARVKLVPLPSGSLESDEAAHTPESLAEDDYSQESHSLLVNETWCPIPSPEELDLVLHTFCDPHIPLGQAHQQAEEIQRALRLVYPELGSVVIHTEPPEEELLAAP